MKIFYQYKGKLFDDIREIIQNNQKKLSPNWEYIFFEYLPYQVFISGRTFFREITIIPNTLYNPEDQHRNIIDGSNIRDIFNQYLESFNFSKDEKYTAAVSGGIDSSVVTTIMKPCSFYTGYYDDPEYDERKYSDEIAKSTGCIMYDFLLEEEEYLYSIDEFLKAVCTPIAGMGGPAEYMLLRGAKERIGFDSVFFGNGGDEVFCGYPYNHLLYEMITNAEKKHDWMENFAPFRKNFVHNNINIFFNLYNYRGAGIPDHNPFSKLKGDYLDKLLHVNINYTLPSLLHLNQQMCLANNVKGYNPLASEILIKHARMFNDPFSVIPKQRLRTMVNIPTPIAFRADKMGFPIPFHKWDEMNRQMKEAHESMIRFIDDNNYNYYDLKNIQAPYDGINRRTWAIFMIDRWRRLFKYI